MNLSEFIKGLPELNGNVKLIIAIISSFSFFIPWKFLKPAYESFSNDSFDLLLKSKEQRNILNHIKEVSIFLLTILIYTGIMLFEGYAFSVNDILEPSYGYFTIIYSILFLIWWIVYKFKAFNFIILIIKFLKKNISDQIIVDKLNNIHHFLLYYFWILWGGIFSMELIDMVQTNDILTNILISIFIIFCAIFIYMNMKREHKKRNIKYKFTATYVNTIPTVCTELFLDRVIDNYTHILSSNNGDYKAIKYRSAEAIDSFSIELYKKINYESSTTN